MTCSVEGCDNKAKNRVVLSRGNIREDINSSF